MFSVQHNAFGGALVSLSSEHSLIDDQQVRQLIEQQSQLGKLLIWIDIPLAKADLVATFQRCGFVFHNCEEHRLTMIFRLQDDAYAPFSPTHTVGMGGIVQNQLGQVLLVRDKWMGGKGFKIPGGYADLGETLHAAAEREVFEETGINANFDGLVSLVHKHPHQYNKSNLYVICRLTPQHEIIDIQDSDEIECAQWMNPEQFVADLDSSAFHRHMVANLRHSPVLAIDDFDFRANDSLKHMYRMLF